MRDPWNGTRIRSAKTAPLTLYEVTDVLKEFDMEKQKTTNPFTLSPLGKRLQTSADETKYAVRIAVSSSARNDTVGIGGAIQVARSARSSPRLETFLSQLG